MSRAKILMAMALVSLVTLSCTNNSDDNVNREILWSTVWKGQCFQPFSQQGQDEECLYIFGGNGIMRVYSVDNGIPGHSKEDLRYIYTPQAAEIVIESYGLFSVKEITVDRLLLEGSRGTLDLRFYGDIAVAPPAEL